MRKQGGSFVRWTKGIKNKQLTRKNFWRLQSSESESEDESRCKSGKRSQVPQVSEIARLKRL